MLSQVRSPKCKLERWKLIKLTLFKLRTSKTPYVGRAVGGVWFVFLLSLSPYLHEIHAKVFMDKMMCYLGFSMKYSRRKSMHGEREKWNNCRMLMVSSEAQNVKTLMMSSLSISFLFVAYAFDVISKKLLTEF